MIKPNRLFAHIHIPKCAGTSASFYLARFFIRSYRFPMGGAPICGWDKVRLISGHFQFNNSLINSCFPKRDIKYLTIIREPLERSVSFYYWWLNTVRHDSEQRTFADWYDTFWTNETRHLIWNPITWYLSGMPGRVTRDHLEQAKKNLRHITFSTMGRNTWDFTKFFDVMIRKFPERFNLSRSMPRENVTPLPNVFLTNGEIKIIKTLIEFDIELWDYAVRLER